MVVTGGWMDEWMEWNRCDVWTHDYRLINTASSSPLIRTYPKRGHPITRLSLSAGVAHVPRHPLCQAHHDFILAQPASALCESSMKRGPCLGACQLSAIRELSAFDHTATVLANTGSDSFEKRGFGLRTQPS